MKTMLYFLNYYRTNCPSLRYQSAFKLTKIPQWFRHGRDCKLTNKTMFQNFPSYIRTEWEQFSSIFEELQQTKFKQKPIYSANAIHYALMLRYSLLQAIYSANAIHYALMLRYSSSQTLEITFGKILFTILALLRKISKGKIDALTF